MAATDDPCPACKNLNPGFALLCMRCGLQLRDTHTTRRDAQGPQGQAQRFPSRAEPSRSLSNLPVTWEQTINAAGREKQLELGALSDDELMRYEEDALMRGLEQGEDIASSLLGVQLEKQRRTYTGLFNWRMCLPSFRERFRKFQEHRDRIYDEHANALYTKMFQSLQPWDSTTQAEQEDDGYGPPPL